MLNSAWIHDPIPQPDAQVRTAALQRQAQLTKPPGALGQLETLAVRLAALQGQVCPQLEQIQVVIFAADHGVVAEGVSAFPQAVTAEMIRNFARGGAAISVLAHTWGAALEVVNLGTVQPLELLDGVVDRRVGPGTRNFTQSPAMTVAELEQALLGGCEAVQRAASHGCQLFIGGEMGIGNTTSASALACALLNLPASQLSGPGTGLTAQGVSHKAQVIEKALARRQPSDDPLVIVRQLGGFEIAGLVGAYLRCAQRGIPVLVDGFISSVAALVGVRLRPELSEWLLFAHRSAEPGHLRVLEALDAQPLLDLGMRLGEGSGAAVALPLLRAACALHGQMATFAEAGVSVA